MRPIAPLKSIGCLFSLMHNDEDPGLVGRVEIWPCQPARRKPTRVPHGSHVVWTCAPDWLKCLVDLRQASGTEHIILAALRRLALPDGCRRLTCRWIGLFTVITVKQPSGSGEAFQEYGPNFIDVIMRISWGKGYQRTVFPGGLGNFYPKMRLPSVNKVWKWSVNDLAIPRARHVV